MTTDATVRVLTDVSDVHAAARLINDTWSAPLVMPNLARAIAHAGGYVAGIFDDGEIVGASVAFRGSHRGAPTLHSHVTAVTRRHRGLGLQLKLHQHRWCADNGIVAVTWTFDPLVSRNAYFNLAKLGVVCDAYLQNHYGEMADGLNAGDETDRLHVWWPVRPEHPAAAADPAADTAERQGGALPLLLDRGPGDQPLPPRALPQHGLPAVGLRVPLDIDAIRRTDPVLARSWRLHAREAFLAAYGAGYTATSMRRDGTYLLTRPLTRR